MRHGELLGLTWRRWTSTMDGWRWSSNSFRPVAASVGGPIYPSRLTERFAELRDAAGIPTGTLHTLRHSSATLALTSGVPVHIVAARLGDDPKTILGTYAHLLPQSDELAAERVAAALTVDAGGVSDVR
jgi:integrase